VTNYSVLSELYITPFSPGNNKIANRYLSAKIKRPSLGTVLNWWRFVQFKRHNRRTQIFTRKVNTSRKYASLICPSCATFKRSNSIAARYPGSGSVRISNSLRVKFSNTVVRRNAGRCKRDPKVAWHRRGTNNWTFLRQWRLFLRFGLLKIDNFRLCAVVLDNRQGRHDRRNAYYS